MEGAGANAACPERTRCTAWQIAHVSHANGEGIATSVQSDSVNLTDFLVFQIHRVDAVFQVATHRVAVTHLGTNPEG